MLLLVICDVHVTVGEDGFSGRLDCARTMVVIERPVAAGAFVEPFLSALSRDSASVRWDLISGTTPLKGTVSEIASPYGPAGS